MRTDQVIPALIEGTRHRRTRRNMMETMSKRNYVIGVREPIGGDRSPRECENKSEECPLPVVKGNGVGKSEKRGRGVVRKRSDRNITPLLHPKLRRRITYERRESEVDVRRDGGASHVGDGDIGVLWLALGAFYTTCSVCICLYWIYDTSSNISYVCGSMCWRCLLMLVA